MQQNSTHIGHRPTQPPSHQHLYRCLDSATVHLIKYLKLVLRHRNFRQYFMRKFCGSFGAKDWFFQNFAPLQNFHKNGNICRNLNFFGKNGNIEEHSICNFSTIFFGRRKYVWGLREGAKYCRTFRRKFRQNFESSKLNENRNTEY